MLRHFASFTSLRRRAASDRRGAIAAEFALISPLLLAMVFSVIKFGIAINHNLALNNGVRAAAREFAVSRSNATVYTDTVARFHASAPGLNRSAVVLTAAVNGVACASNGACQIALAAAAGQPATLTASYACDLTVFAWNLIPGCTLVSQTAERVE